MQDEKYNKKAKTGHASSLLYEKILLLFLLFIVLDEY